MKHETEIQTPRDGTRNLYLALIVLQNAASWYGCNNNSKDPLAATRCETALYANVILKKYEMENSRKQLHSIKKIQSIQNVKKWNF